MKTNKRTKNFQEFICSIDESISTQESKNNPRENLLQAKGKLYELNKQKLKHQIEKDIMLQAPFVPAINSSYQSDEK
jgi:hypothetical protein